ncbi:hypothetical protein [Gemmobacter sp. 24YEA27]|uniref:hypothetical protein n=1 Tax=Gemmobacter sp. 24YEA27 TaxID=3040672 RepID=UPI0024B37243|nr:hypothetical protein [Gemmobacter sp. 24YEA27]
MSDHPEQNTGADLTVAAAGAGLGEGGSSAIPGHHPGALAAVASSAGQAERAIPSPPTPEGDLISRGAALAARQTVMDGWRSMRQPHPALGAKNCRDALASLPASQAQGEAALRRAEEKAAALQGGDAGDGHSTVYNSAHQSADRSNVSLTQIKSVCLVPAAPEPVSAGVNEAIRKAKGAGMLEERRRWWRPEYPGQIEPDRVVWYRDEPETGLSGFDTEADREAFRAGGNGPFIRRVTGNEYAQMPVAALRTPPPASADGEVKE